MKKIILSIAIGLFTLTTYGQEIQESNQIYVRIYEAWSGMNPSQIVISYGDGKTEEIYLENQKPRNWKSNTDKINEVLYNIRKAGYKIISSNSNGFEGISINSYLFVKEEKDN